MKPTTRTEYRQRRHMRLRKNVQGTQEKPRMSVYVSNRHMYVQFIDDLAATTLAAATTSVKADKIAKNDVAAAKALGKRAAELAKGKGIAKVVFDRGGFAYSGRVKALADAAREAGLQF